jgi:hypothetical protein
MRSVGVEEARDLLERVPRARIASSSASSARWPRASRSFRSDSKLDGASSEASTVYCGTVDAEVAESVAFRDCHSPSGYGRFAQRQLPFTQVSVSRNQS